MLSRPRQLGWIVFLWGILLVVGLPLGLVACGDDGGGAPAAATGGAAGTGGSGQQEQAATPRFNPPGGKYDKPQSIQITTTTPDATIYYTVDGNQPNDGSPVYDGPVLIGVGTTSLRAIATADGYADSEVNTATYVIEEPTTPVAATPTFAPPAGTYSTPQQVTIATTTPGAEIHFTLDGSGPTASSPVYDGPLSVSATTTIKAIATAPNYLDSPVASAIYEFPSKAAAPEFSPPGGTYDGAQTVSLSAATPGAVIYYTSDGTAPDATSAQYTMPVFVSSTMTIRAIAIAPGYLDSDIADATYTILTGIPAAEPVFNPPGGTYGVAQSVSISTTTPGASIRYTIDGSDPGPGSTLYAAPIDVANSLTLKAIANAPNYDPSPIATAVYTIGGGAQALMPTISPNGGTFTTPQSVTLATAEPAGVILYTLDGTLPTVGNGSVYSGAFTLSQSTTVNAVTSAPGKQNSNPATAVFTIDIPQGQVAPITITPGTASSDNDLDVTFSTATVGAAICYTTDSSVATCSVSGGCQTGQTYGGTPVLVNQTGTTLTAIGCMAGMIPSDPAAATYTLETGPVQFSPAPGTVPYGTTVLMSSSTLGATIRYRTDGVAPTCTTGSLYIDPVPITIGTSFRATACKASYGPSPLTVQNGVYSLQLLQLTPTRPTENVANRVTDASFHVQYPSGFPAPAGTKLCYTVDGAAPTCAANGDCEAGNLTRPLVSDPMLGSVFGPVGETQSLAYLDPPSGGNSTRTVQAITCAPNYLASPVSTVVYTFKAATPSFSRPGGTSTLPNENAANSLSTWTALPASLRYYDIVSGNAAPTLSCAGAPAAGVVQVNSNVTTVSTNGGHTLGAIACKTDYLASDIVVADYPVPDQTAAPVFSTQGTAVFNNDIAPGAIQVTTPSIPNVGLQPSPPAGVVCWTTAASGTLDCTPSATAPICSSTPAPGGTYSLNAGPPPLSNVPASAIASNGVQLRAIACAPGLTKSTVTTQALSFEVGAVTIKPPPAATSDTIGVGEVLQFTSITANTTFRYTVGTQVAPPVNPNCSTVGTPGASYTVTNGDALNGSLVVKVIGCKNGYAPAAVVTSDLYTNFRGGAVVFSIPAGTYGDVFETGSSNAISGQLNVSAGGATVFPVRICLTADGFTPACEADNTCSGSASHYYGGNAGIPGGPGSQPVPWSFLDDYASGFTVQAIACYASVSEPPVTAAGPYRFQTAPLALVNVTSANPGNPPYSSTQRIRFRIGTESPAVNAPFSTAAGTARLCYTTDGAPLGAGCASSGSMTCVNATASEGTHNRYFDLYPDSTMALAAKACKSTLEPSTTDGKITINPYSRSLLWSGLNDFLGYESQEAFGATEPFSVGSNAQLSFYLTYDSNYVYAGWRGCWIRPIAANTGNLLHIYLGTPGAAGTNLQQAGMYTGAQAMTAFSSGMGGARWHVIYNVETQLLDVRVFNFSNVNWNDVVPNHGVSAVNGAGVGAFASCGGVAANGNYGDYVLVRIPLAVMGTPRTFRLASALWDSTYNTGAWPVGPLPYSQTTPDWIPFQTTANAGLIDRLSWRQPRGATTCYADGIDGRATCQFPDPYTTQQAFTPFP